ncbi:MAG: hypothetical protein ACLPXT_12275 [Terracidiphilus sp.]
MRKTLRSAAFILAFALMAAGALHAQQAVAPPPNPSGSGPSLETTMQFIQDNAAEGKLSYTASVSDASQQGAEWSNKFTVEMSNLAADAGACRLTYHWRAEENGKLADDADYSLALKDVKEIVVLSQDQNQNQVDSRNGHPDWNSHIAPSLFTLIARRPKGVVNVFLFSDETMANRVAKAITHAVELCGGGKDPF